MNNIVTLTIYTMTSLEKFVNKKVLLVSAIVVVGILSAGIFIASPVGNLWAQQQMITKNDSMYGDIPKINGSVNVGEQLKNFFKQGTKIPFTTATETAQKQVANGTVLGGHFGITQGYLTYVFFIVDPTSQTGHKVIVDAGNGKVLYTSEGFSIASLASSWKGHGDGAWHGIKESWNGPGFGAFWHALFGR